MKPRTIFDAVLVAILLESLLKLLTGFEISTLIATWLITIGVGLLLHCRNFQHHNFQWFITLAIAITCFAMSLAFLADAALALGNTAILQRQNDESAWVIPLIIFVFVQSIVCAIYAMVQVRKRRRAGYLLLIAVLFELVFIIGALLPALFNPLP